MTLLALPLLLEVRGAWIGAEDLERLSTRKAVAEAMALLGETGFNAVFPPLSAEGRDLLAEIQFEAHRRGIEVLPWIDPKDRKAAVDACRVRDLDGVVPLRPIDGFAEELAAVEPGLVAPPMPEEACRIPLAKLLEKDGELARSLGEGAHAEETVLPWRKDRARRPPAAEIEPFAGGGVWTWVAREGEPRFLSMDGGETGHATWTTEPEAAGSYALYAWIPAREDLAAHASYKIASAGSMRTIGIDTREGRNRGWVYLGEARLVAGERIEVARLDAEEQDATRITAAGPLVALRSHRPKPR